MIAPRSIFFRQLASHIAVILFLTLLLHGLMLYIIYIDHEMPFEIHSRIITIARYLSAEFEAGRIPDTQSWQLLNEATGTTMWLADTDGNVLGGTPPQNWQLNCDLRKLSTQSSESIKLVQPGEKNTAILAVPAKAHKQPVFLFTYYNSKSFYLFAWERFNEFYVMPFTIGIIAAILLAIIMSQTLTRSIADIAQAAARFSAGNYASRTKVAGSDELGLLGQTFNKMADAIVHTQQTRREFYTNVSHELKTPISCIQAMTEALLDGIAKTPADLQQYLQRIHSEIARMSRMVYDLLDLEQLEAGKMGIQLSKTDVAKLLIQQADKIEELLKGKTLSLVLRLETNQHFVFADADRLTQVLDNLLSNAIRYAPNGSRIGLILKEDGDFLSICVSDQGSGIPVKEMPLIWERFYRIDKSRDNASGNRGLGLSITRSLVEAMSGKITVGSKVGNGTVFTVTLPQYH